MTWLALVLALEGAVPLAAVAPAPTEVPLAGLPHSSYVTIPTRPGVTQSFLLIEPERAVANLIAFAGGSGEIRQPGGMMPIGPTGLAPFFTDTLVLRSRERLAAAGLRVAVLDIPSDQSSLDQFRTTPEHAQDIAAVIAFLRRRGGGPVWLLGTSRGSISAAHGAAALHGREGADGVVLASSILRPGPGRDPATVFSVPLGEIRIPVLVVHHEQDQCPVTLFADVPPLLAALAHAPEKKLQSFTGGGPAAGNPCGAQHHHGYVGQADAVAAAVTRTIRAHLHPRLRGRAPLPKQVRP